MPLNVYVLEAPGSYGDQVRRKVLPDSNPIFIATNEGIVEQVVSLNGIGIIPVANSHRGRVEKSWDALEENRDHLIIAGSHEFTLDHALVKLKGKTSGNVTAVFSHEQAYGQSILAVQKACPHHIFHKTESTVGGLCELKDETQAAICSARAIEQIPELREKYEIVQRNIGPENNRTKFVVIATRQSVVEIMGLPPSQIDVVMAILKDRRFELVKKLSTIGILGGNIHEWANKKAEPGKDPRYIQLLITSRLWRNWLTKKILNYTLIKPIPHKEDLISG